MIEVCIKKISPLLCAEGLSEYRQRKAEGYKNENARLLSIAAGLALDELLRRHGLRERDMTYLLTETGKPYFDGCPLKFNLSHSGQYACAALGMNELGVDLQEITVYDPRVAHRCFTEGEMLRLEGVADPAGEFAFIWSRRESAVKLTGAGLSQIQSVDTDAYFIKSFRTDGGWLSVCSYTEEEVLLCGEGF